MFSGCPSLRACVRARERHCPSAVCRRLLVNFPCNVLLRLWFRADGTTVATRSRVTYRAHLQATPGLNGATVSCTTDFVESSRRRVRIAHLTFANNTPAYRHTWTSQTLDVLCMRAQCSASIKHRNLIIRLGAYVI